MIRLGKWLVIVWKVKRLGRSLSTDALRRARRLSLLLCMPGVAWPRRCPAGRDDSLKTELDELRSVGCDRRVASLLVRALLHLHCRPGVTPGRMLRESPTKPCRGRSVHRWRLLSRPPRLRQTNHSPNTFIYMAAHVESFEVPPFGCNCTIVGDPETKEAVVVDPVRSSQPNALRQLMVCQLPLTVLPS